MKVTWREYLSVGVQEIDSQHQQLFDKFNDFISACELEKGGEEVLKLFGFLDDYVASHFRDEEHFQKKIGYPEYERHRELHRLFTQELLQLKSRLAAEGPQKQLVSTASRLVTGWLIEHISGTDRAIGTFYKEKSRREQNAGTPGSIS